MEAVNYTQIESLILLELSTEENILDNLLDIYKNEVPLICSMMRDKYYQKDNFEVSNLAHKLKTSAANLGFDIIANYCLMIETECRKKTPLDYLDLINKIELESISALENAKNYISNAKSKAS